MLGNRVTPQEYSEHHEVVPNHSPIKSEHRNPYLRNAAAHYRISVPELLERFEL